MLRFYLLGRPIITLDEQPVTAFASEKELLLLCYLLANRGEHSRPQLAGMLWGEMTEERARANLSTAVYNLRQLLPGYVEASRKTAAFIDDDSPVWLDTAALQEALVGGDELAAVVAYYRGPFLEGIYPQGAPEVEEWLQQQRERWRLLALTALERLVHSQTEAGEWQPAIATVRQLLALEPWHEQSHRLLMRLLARTGQFNAALAQYDACRKLLAAELGVEPMAETTAVYQRIQAARARSQVHNLPLQPAPLVGRDAELGHLFTLFNDPGRRLITLAGPGGSGKTRLAIAAAGAQAHAFLDGVVFVPLAGATTRTGLVLAVASALGLTQAGVDEAQLLAYLRGKEMLLLLDNVEQALEPAADLIVAMLEAAPRLRLLVTSREYLQLRWETRLLLAGLGTPGEADDAATVATSAAVRLFVQVAQRVQPDVAPAAPETAQAVAALCRLVEGIPLAIELAAALIDRETPAQLLAQVSQGLDRLATTMRDMPARHRSLRAVFDHSWVLLTSPQQAALARLALFQGGFSRQAATVVANASPALLAELAAKSLLRPQKELAGDRYDMHEVVRQYALEELQASGQSGLATTSYAAYFAAQLGQAAADLYGPQQTAAAGRLWADVDNIQAAWKMAAVAGNWELLVAAAPGLARFYQVAGLFQAGVEAFAAAIASLPATTPVPAALYLYHATFLVECQEYTAALAAVAAASNLGLDDPSLAALAHLNAARVYLQQGDPANARSEAKVALTEATNAGVLFLQAQTWRHLAWIERVAGNYMDAEESLRRALDIYQESGDPLELAQSFQGLALIHLRRGQDAAAEALLEKALVIQQQIDPIGLSRARILVNLGTVTYNVGRKEQARHHFQEALTVFQNAGDRSNEALAVDMLGRMAAFAGRFDEARAYYEQSLALRQAIGHHKGTADAQRHLADLALNLGAYDEAQRMLEEVLEKYEAIQDRRGYGTSLTRLALALHHRGEHEAARQRAETALVVAEELDSVLVRGQALSSLGHAWRGQRAWQGATAAYQAAIAIWEDLAESGWQAELEAALAAVYYAAGRPAEARPLLEAALAYLLETPQPDCDAPATFYLDCIMLLQVWGDKRAEGVLAQAVEMVRERAAGIADDEERANFLNGIGAHRRLFALLAGVPGCCSV